MSSTHFVSISTIQRSQPSANLNGTYCTVRRPPHSLQAAVHELDKSWKTSSRIFGNRGLGSFGGYMQRDLHAKNTNPA